MYRVEKGDGWELRLGRYQDVLADVTECDAVITDPPYSDRVHSGIRTGWMPGGEGSGEYTCTPIGYDPWDESVIDAFVESWSARATGWMVAMTDHVMGHVYQRAYRDAQRYAFAPVPFVEMGKQPRVTGDGPASWTCWIMVARPSTRKAASCGSLPGAYVPPTGQGVQQDWYIKGGKPSWLMRALVRDYSRPGDLVVDPCAGGGTTLLAAVTEGRRAIGAEMDPDTFELAVKRLRRGHTRTLDFGGAE